MATLTKVEAVFGEETRVCLPGAGARKVLELGKGLHVYGEGLRKGGEKEKVAKFAYI